MARRLFSSQIVDSDAFLDMPASAQNLYFHLGMRADDDGFVGNPKKICRMCGANDDDLKVLMTKRFVLCFENGVIVIKHWLIHNSIRKDRYTCTQYLEEKATLHIKENKAYTDDKNVGVPLLGNHSATKRQPKRREVKLSKDNRREDNSSFKKKEKRFYQNQEMRFAQNKWWVIPKDGGQWLEFDMRAFKETEVK